ncbi:MAG: hypothetical protein PHX68_02995 [Alphaproteobacteria bacterium]|nr:hypothetical protein [Alphaproteobacteria bacterium]
MELTWEQIDRLQQAVANADLTTLFFMTLMPEKIIENDFANVMEDIQRRNLTALFDRGIDYVSVEPGQQAVDIWRVMSFKERYEVLFMRDQSGNTAPHVLGDAMCLDLMRATPSEERAAVASGQNANDDTILHVIRNDQVRVKIYEELPPKDRGAVAVIRNKQGNTFLHKMSDDVVRMNIISLTPRAERLNAVSVENNRGCMIPDIMSAWGLKHLEDLLPLADRRKMRENLAESESRIVAARVREAEAAEARACLQSPRVSVSYRNLIAQTLMDRRVRQRD